jgi:hypothetical protein
MSDSKLFRQYIDIINEESPVYAQRNQQAAQKWAQENPDAAQAVKTGLNVVTDFIPGVSQVKSAYRAGKAAMGGDYTEAGKQLVGTFVPGGRRMVGAVDAGIDAAKGNYKGALTNLSYAAGGDLGRLGSAYALGSTVNDLTKTSTPNNQVATAIQAADDDEVLGPTKAYTPSNALKSLTRSEPTTEEVEEVEEVDELEEMKKMLRKFK